MGAAVTTAPADAYDSAADSFRPMVLVRSGPEASGRLRGLAESGSGVRVRPQMYDILPYTYARGAGAVPAPAVTEAALLHAARAGSGRLRGAASYALVVEGRAADAAGEPVVGAEAMQLPPP